MSTAIIGKKRSSGGVEVPAFPSKSEAHRLLLTAALADRETVFVCPEVNADILATADCLSALGARVERTASGFCVHPMFSRRRPGDGFRIDVGESGSTLRFLLPLLCSFDLETNVVMHGRLPDRPLAPLDRVLTEHGARLLKNEDGTLTVSGRITPGEYCIDGGVSSQFASGLLFALPLLDGDSTLTLSGRVESAPYIELTLRALAEFGVDIPHTEDYSRFFIRGNSRPHSPLSGGSLTVGGDWSGAAFYLAAGAVGTVPVTVTGLDVSSAQGDREILALLQKMGARTEVSGDRVTVYPSALHGIQIGARNIPDLVPVLAVLGAYAAGETVITGAERLRLKESDRLATTSALLTALGAEVCVTADGLVIAGTGACPTDEKASVGGPETDRPEDGLRSPDTGSCPAGEKKQLHGGTVSSENDHRIAMSAAVAALFASGPVSVTGAEAVSKSAPDYWEQMNQIAEVAYHV